MKYIRDVDKEWHIINEEMPPRTTDVEFLQKDGTTVKGEIVVDMAGFYVYIRDSMTDGWGSFDDYTHWRFR